MKCPKCGADVESKAEDKAEGGVEEPGEASGVEMTIEGDAKSIRSILEKLMPRGMKGVPSKGDIAKMK